MKQLTKWQIAVRIETIDKRQRLVEGKDYTWSAESVATAFCDSLTREMLVGWHNRLVDERRLITEKIR